MSSHTHKCMSCGESWQCPQPPGDCKANESVLPSLVLRGPNGPQMFDHICQRKPRSENGGWIPVKERLPDDDLTVMIALDGDEPVWMGWHDDSGWYSADASPMRDRVTHWKPMPESPNG